MPGPGLPSIVAMDEDGDGRSDEPPTSRADCELCQSEKPTMVKYGLRVCRSCDVEYLP